MNCPKLVMIKFTHSWNFVNRTGLYKAFTDNSNSPQLIPHWKGTRNPTKVSSGFMKG